MKPVLKLYLKEFLKAGCIFAFTLSLSDVIFEGLVDYRKVVFDFFFMGIFWSLGSVSIHIELIKKLGFRDLTDDILRSRQVRTFTSTHSQIELLDTLLNDPVFGKMSISKKGNKLKLISGISTDSLGTSITIEKLDQSGDQITYEVVSQPRFNIGQPDFGKSLEYMIRFEKLLGYSSIVTTTQ